MSSVETLPDNNMDPNPNKRKEELDHLRHERNVYEESYIRIQRELDQTQKENESLLEDLKSKQDLIDGFDAELQREKEVARNEMGVKMQEMRSSLDEREQELIQSHLEERSNMESLIGELKVNDVKLPLLNSFVRSTNFPTKRRSKPGQEKRIFFLGAQPRDKNFLQTNGVFLC